MTTHVKLLCLLCLFKGFFLLWSAPSTTTEDYVNQPCSNALTMTVNGQVVPNGATVNVKPDESLIAGCDESSLEGTRMYFLLDGKKISNMTDAMDDVRPADGSLRSFFIDMSVNVSGDLHLKPLRCVAEHAPSNCLEISTVVIQVV